MYAKINVFTLIIVVTLTCFYLYLVIHSVLRISEDSFNYIEGVLRLSLYNGCFTPQSAMSVSIIDPAFLDGNLDA